MKTRNLLSVLALALLCGPTWGQTDWRIVIEPESPDANDLVTISIPGTACYAASEVQTDLEERVIDITLTFFEALCQTVDPNAHDFSTSVGPLAPGQYLVFFTQLLQGKVPYQAAERSFSVAEVSADVSLSPGGINGFYYNPGADGHYVYVLETDFTTLVVWNTFNTNGGQAWIFGTGKLENGKAVVTDAYVNRSDGYSTDGSLKGLEVVPWGTLEVEMTSCWDGTVVYQSDLPEFGSGQFPIRRLAFAKQIGCVEAD
jgi:hypothetical protein